MFQKRKYLFTVVFIVATALGGVIVRAQQDAFLDFEYFSGVIDTEDLNLFDYAKLSGMTIVNTPALQNLVSLYGYSDNEIRPVSPQGDCRDQALGNINVLVIDERIPRELAVSHFAPIFQTKDPEQWKSFLDEIDGLEWITVEMIDKSFNKNNLNSEIKKLELGDVWKEIQVSGFCELEERLPDLLEDWQADWKPVIEHKLQNIINELEEKYQSELFFLVDHRFPDKDPIKKYLAECSNAELSKSQRNSPSVCSVRKSRL